MTDSPRSEGAPRVGSFDVVEWPERLSARVVEPGDDPAIHGYGVESDLAVHHGFVATIYLALVGELPSSQVERALDVALTFLAPVAADEAPTHAAVLTRMCDAPPRSVMAVAAIGLAERAHFVVRQNAELLRWLGEPSAAPPEESTSRLSCHEQQRARLRTALADVLAVPALQQPLTRDAALIAVLFACGLREPQQIEAIWALSGIAASFAEGMATPCKSFRDYPMNLPAFRYEGRQ